MLSARNQFKGTIKSVKLGQIVAEVVVEVAGMEVVALISKGSAEKMNLREGDTATAIVKATEVMIEK